MSLRPYTAELYKNFGPTKPIGASSPAPNRPHYFLMRRFLQDQDLLIILNSKRCRYNCHFCQLPVKSSRTWISADQLKEQFLFVLSELRHSLGVISRLTLSNEGSILDKKTFPADVLLEIAESLPELKSIRRLVLETRLEFVEPNFLREVQRQSPNVTIDILTGFETADINIRDKVLVKREPLSTFLKGLDYIAEARADLTSYVLFKPDPRMTDEDATSEAEGTIRYLREQCHNRGIRLAIRLNPMYAAAGSSWAVLAKSVPDYMPPRLTDVLKLAERVRAEGISVYVGLSTEGLNEPYGTYRSREDFSPKLIRDAILFNQGALDQR